MEVGGWGECGWGGGHSAAFHDPIFRDIKQRPPGNRLDPSSSFSVPTLTTDKAL